MAALLLSAADMLDEASQAAPAVHDDWRWCDVCGVWASGDWQEHVEGSLHHHRLGLDERYGRCAPRGSGGTPDRTIATVVKAPGGVGVVGASVETDEAQRRVRVISRTHLCAMVHRAMVEELGRCCGSPAFARQIITLNGAASLPTLVHGQAIRGHYRNSDELVIHARPCLALLYFYLGALPGVQQLCILVDVHRDLHIDTLYTSAAVALLARFLPLMRQRRLTFQLDLWSGRPLDSLKVTEQAICRFLVPAAVVLATSNTQALREIVIEINPRNVPEPMVLHETRAAFNDHLAAAAKPCRSALLMGLHPRSAAAGCPLFRLPAALLPVIMTEAIPVVLCTCSVTSSLADPETPEASEELLARIKAHDEYVAQQMAAVAWRRRRGRICKALIVGAVTGASLMLAAAWRCAAKERQDAAAKTAARPSAASRRAAAWKFE